MKKFASLAAIALSAAMFLGACGGAATTAAPTTAAATTAAAAETTAAPAETTAAATTAAAEETTAAAAATVEPKDMNIQLVSKGFQHDFWQAVLKGAKQAAEEAGIDVNDTTKFNFVGPASESDVQGQMTQLQTALATKPNALAYASVNVEASLEYLQQAKDAGIPVIGFDSGVPGAPEGTVYANASTDNYAAGELAADEMYRLISATIDGASAPVRVGVAAQEAVSESVIGRTQGFLDKFSSLVGEDKVAIVGFDKYNKGDEATATVILDVCIPANITDADMSAAINPVLAKEDTIAFYASNEMAAKGLLNANESFNKLGQSVVGVGFDSGKVQLDAVRAGVLAGSITQNPVQIGYQAVQLAIKAAQGETVADVDTGCLFYNAENMDTEEIAPCLYE